MQDILLLSSNRKGEVNIKNMQLASLQSHIHLFIHKIQPLDQIHIAADNTNIQGWAKRVSVISTTEVRPILQDLEFLTWGQQIYDSVGRIKVSDNTMSDSMLILNHLPNWMFLRHFALNFLQKKSWRLLLIPSECRWRLTSVLNRNIFYMDFNPPSSIIIPLHGANGANYAFGCASQPTSKVSEIQSLYCISFPRACALVF